ncbi:MAG: energy-coupling factor transporter transmembrane component T [Propionibacteriaceae bacterium]|nr:energy-coupling factor transporter transmembrane component T [Propionibacteriaceae bacterium]
MLHRYFLARPLHPFAWWGWAIALAVVAASTTNVLLLGAIIVVLCLVTVARRGDNPWAKGFKFYLFLGAFLVVMRVAFRVLLGGGGGSTILFSLPSIPLPSWVGGIQLLGPVSLESLLFGFTDGMRLATIIIAVGAANSLVNPKRLLAAFPSALYELGTILVVAFSALPQLGEAMGRVLRVRKLRQRQQPRGRKQRLGWIQTIIVPVLSDALDRSIALAASMEVRGYGRSGRASASERALATALGLVGVLFLTIWAYCLLAKPSIGPSWWGLNLLELALLLAGVAAIVFAMRISGRHVRRTRYQPDRWGAAEWCALLSGVVPVVALQLLARTGSGDVLSPSISPPEWPQLTVPLLGILIIAALPAFLTPPPALTSAPTNHKGLS